MGQLAVGGLFAGYRVEEQLGHGGMGVVYRAWDMKLERSVALKVVAGPVADDPKFRERFRREVLAAAAIGHPHVVPVFEAGDVDGLPYLAMQLINGVDLGTLIAREGRLAPDRAVRLITQLASALDAAHEVGVVHRDVKPGNVLVKGEVGHEHAYLTDFGIAKRAGREEPITRTGAFLGTLDYAAPETFRGEPAGPAADIYGLGCVLYVALVGEVPFPRDTDAAKVSAVLYEPAPALAGRFPELTEELDEAVHRALAKVPAERFASAGDLAQKASLVVARSTGVLGSAPVWPPATRPVGPSLPTESLRRQVTLLLSSVAPAAGTLEPDPEARTPSQERFVEAASVVMERHGGTVLEVGDDLVVGAFGLSRLREDDALWSVRAACEINESWRNTSDSRSGTLSPRSAISTGVALVQAPGLPTPGLAGIKRSAMQLHELTAPGGISVSDATRPLIEQAVDLEALGDENEDRVVAWRLKRLLPDAEVAARMRRTPFVGRARELGQLERALDRVIDDRATVVFTVIGAPGIGKTRLAAEFGALASARADIAMCRCRPAGQETTWAPIAQLVRDLAGSDFEAGIAQILGSGPDAEAIAVILCELAGDHDVISPPGDITWAVQRLIIAAAAKRPVVLVFEDLHWAEPTLLDLIDHLAEWARSAPVLLLCLARPEVIDERPEWGGGKFNSESLLLRSLSQDACEALISGAPGGTQLTTSTRRRLLERAEGNPLFVEQMLALVRDRGRAVSELPIAPSIQALLTARLDRLPPAERQIVSRAAVIGKEFSLGIVACLLSDDERTDLSRGLQALVRADFIEPASVARLSEEFRFRHMLIRDAAYQALPKRARAELHEQISVALEDVTAALDQDELLGHHLAAACSYWTELEPADPRSQEVRDRACDRLRAAGARALDRGDSSGAVRLFADAVRLFKQRAEADPALLIGFGCALHDSGDLAAADEVLTDAAEAARRSGSRQLELHALLNRAMVRISMDISTGLAAVPVIVEPAMRLFRKSNDELGLATAEFAQAMKLIVGCRFGAATDALQRSMTHARHAGDRRVQRLILEDLLSALYLGPTHADRVIEQYELLMTGRTGDRATEALVQIALGVALALKADFAGARDRYAAGIRSIDEFGRTLESGGQTQAAGWIEMLAGDAAAAERELRRGYLLLGELGERALRSTVAGQLAESLHALGRDDEALQMSEHAEELSASDDLASQFLWRRARALALAERDVDQAERLARDALALVSETDQLSWHADALQSLAQIRAGRDPEEAAALSAKALALYREKGNKPGEERVTQMLSELAANRLGRRQ
jgi:serine/threonine protein kinase